MNCDKFQAILQDLGKDFPLDLRTRQAGLAHAEQCPACAARLKDECRLLAGLEAVAASFKDIEAPPNIEEALLKAFRDRNSKQGKEKPSHGAEGGQPSTMQPSPNWHSSGALCLTGREVVNKEGFLRRPECAKVEEGPADAFNLDKRPWSGWRLRVAAVALLAIGLAAWFSLRLGRKSEQSISQMKDLSAQKNPQQLSSRILPPVIPDVPKATRAHSAQAKSSHSRVTSRPASQITQLRHPAPVPDLEEPSAQDVPEVEQEQIEVATEFLPLSYGEPVSPVESGQLVRVRLPRTTLLTFGFPMSEERAPEPIKADVLLGEDGKARAIRFVH